MNRIMAANTPTEPWKTTNTPGKDERRVDERLVSSRLSVVALACGGRPADAGRARRLTEYDESKNEEDLHPGRKPTAERERGEGV